MTLAGTVLPTDPSRKTPSNVTERSPAFHGVGQRVSDARVTRARVRSLIHGHINWLGRAALEDTNRAGLGVTPAFLQACHEAVRRSVPDIEGSAARIVLALAQYWPGALPFDPTNRALRAALNRLAGLSPFVVRCRGGWRIRLGLARATDAEDPRLEVLAKAELLQRSGAAAGFRRGSSHGIVLRSVPTAQDSYAEPYKERARPPIGVLPLESRWAWLSAASRTGRVWGKVTGEMISSWRGGPLEGRPHDVAVTLLAARGATARKWAQRPYTQRERQGLTRALQRLLEAGLLAKDGERWVVPTYAAEAGEQAGLTEDVATLAAEIGQAEAQQAEPESKAITVLREVAAARGWALGKPAAVRRLDEALKQREARYGCPEVHGGEHWRRMFDEYGPRARYVAPYLAMVLEASSKRPEHDLAPSPMLRAKAELPEVPTYVRTTPLRPFEAAAEARASAKGWQTKRGWAS